MFKSGERALLGACHQARSDPNSNQRVIGIDRVRAYAHDTSCARRATSVGHASTARSCETPQMHLCAHHDGDNSIQSLTLGPHYWAPEMSCCAARTRTARLR